MKVEYNDYELVYLVREQNEAALDILIQKYSPLIGKIASSYYGVGFDYEDFFQEGRMAFIKSIYRKAKRSAGLDLLTDYSDPVLPIASEAQVYYYLDRDHNTLNERLLLEFALREKGILSEFEKTCLKYYLLDNNYIEIATILSVPPKKVDNALSRCKSKLKNLNKINSSSGQCC